VNGIHTSGTSGASVVVNSGGATPTIVAARPLMTIEAPIAFGSALYRMRQVRSLRTTTPAAPALSSVALIVRPSRACTPTVSK
jgi:hypothetical protein